MSQKVFYITNPRVQDKYLIPSIIEESGDSVEIITSKIELNQKFEDNDIPGLIICDRCTFLLKENQIKRMNRNCFNIHPSFLPYNRGYHPNFWSFYYNTPSGTTIHAIDESIDTGNIIAQTQYSFSDQETLRTSYYTLRKLSVSLFKIAYPNIRKGYGEQNLISNNKSDKNLKFKKDFEGIFEQLPNGWDTEIGYIRRMRQK